MRDDERVLQSQRSLFWLVVVLLVLLGVAILVRYAAVPSS
jgi:hypothetical protein